MCILKDNNSQVTLREENGKTLNRDEYYQLQKKINYHIENNNLGEGTQRQTGRLC